MKITWKMDSKMLQTNWLLRNAQNKLKLPPSLRLRVSKFRRSLIDCVLENRSKSKRKTAKKQGSNKGKGGGDPYDEIEKKDQHIGDLNQTIGIMELKISKLEQLVSLKEHKIEMLEKTLKDIMNQQEN